ncbi:MAG: hypothetical protein QG657_4205 [Acidobacteriota bacterium]|nr:hypothetical protein [Acidobacteriota bacterium]
MMKKRFNLSFTLITGVLIVMWIALCSPGIWAQSTAEGDNLIQAVKTKVKPKIDGVLDDPIWQTPALKKAFISYEPRYGDELSMDTLVWVANDSKNLYFAFKCADPEPDKIKTSLTKRDNMSGDDWVSVSIDTAGAGQTAYTLYVNPSGIQGDGLASGISMNEDLSPDFVWDSAAKMTEEGYQVEICLPLKSISYQSGKEVKMGILFRRKVSRLSFIGAWPDIKLNRAILDSQAKVIFTEIKEQRKIEVLPSLTYSNNSERLSPDSWEKTYDKMQFGIGLKYGITSSITADLTFNPDFSQVESDAFQVAVNQRYPLFYSEKRPFFMEGMDIFNFWTYIYGYLPTPVHTRQIVDPAWGAKLTGSTGNFSFGVLSAGDDAPGKAWDTGVNPNLDKQAFFGIARGKYSLGSDNYVGFLYSGRGFSDEYNHVFGADGGLRIANKHRIRASFIHSASRDSEGKVTNGRDTNYGTFVYTYGSKVFQWVGILEHFGRDLRVDSAFLQRTGINMGRMWSTVNFYIDEKKISWLKRISPEIQVDYVHDLYTHKDDSLVNASLNFQLIKEAYLIFSYQFSKEYWQGKTFDLNLFKVTGQVRLTNWLRVAAAAYRREGIYYYAFPSFKGKGNIYKVIMDIQPNKNLNQYFSYTHNDLSKDGNKLYNVNLYYSKTTYQFNKYFFLRAVLQYNSYSKQMLTDFLASFTLIPGTVLHVGYGGLYENRDWVNNHWVVGEGDLMNIKRSFFAKVSYLWRF